MNASECSSNEECFDSELSYSLVVCMQHIISKRGFCSFFLDSSREL